MREEALTFYWQNAHFNFKSTKSLVDFLTSIGHGTLCKLRHISVRGYPLPLYRNVAHPSYYTTYSFSDVLPLFPGMQLSTLCLGDPFHGQWAQEDGWGHDAAYNAVETFIKSQGFKELIYIVEHDRFMKPVSFTSFQAATATQPQVETTKTTDRHPQPSTWDSLIKERDGADSGASVPMYRLLDGGQRRLPLKVEFETVQEPSEENADGQIEIRIRRGSGSHYAQQGELFNQFAQPLSDLFKELTWNEILEKDLYLDGEDDPTAHL
ncbi:MAG: hypothetical protein Q9201_003106 [Fulgogasparrea decipioides]